MTKINVKPEFIMDAELMDIGTPAPKPGVIYAISLMQYRVLKIVEGLYTKEYVLVGHHVPDITAKEFNVGVYHRLWLVREFPSGASLLNTFQNESLPADKLFCIYFQVSSYMRDEK